MTLAEEWTQQQDIVQELFLCPWAPFCAALKSREISRLLFLESLKSQFTVALSEPLQWSHNKPRSSPVLMTENLPFPMEP